MFCVEIKRAALGGPGSKCHLNCGNQLVRDAVAIPTLDHARNGLFQLQIAASPASDDESIIGEIILCVKYLLRPVFPDP